MKPCGCIIYWYLWETFAVGIFLNIHETSRQYILRLGCFFKIYLNTAVLYDSNWAVTLYWYRDN